MSFKSKMKNRGMSKLDSIVEIPESVTFSTPKKSFNPLVRIAVPIAASLVVLAAIVLPISLNINKGNDANGGAGMPSDPSYSDDMEGGSSGGAPSSEGSPANELIYNNVRYNLFNPLNEKDTINKELIRIDFSKPYSELVGDKVSDISAAMNIELSVKGQYSLYHLKNSNSMAVLLATNGKNYYFYSAVATASLPIDAPLNDILNFYGIDNYSFIEAYTHETINNKKSYYTKLTYTFDNETSTSIINNLKTIPSDFSSIEERNKNYDRDDVGFPKGICYLFVVSDGIDCLPLSYVSQSSDITTCRSVYSIKNSNTYSIMNSKIEMDYDPNYSF